ncbi:MAG: hypothetical protein K6A32_04060, partial [Bacteroidales bacterium]|nr:hypothetical protein [Bacteroidales bacterium]
KIALMLTAGLLLMACNSEKKVEKKSLVVYYSVTNTTKTAATCIQEQTGADMAELQAKAPYSTNFDEIIQRSQEEMQNNVLPEVLPLAVDLADYDTIFVGYPIWYGTYALPMKSWLASVDLSGKVVVPFATFGSGGYAQSVADLKQQQPNAQVLEGFGIRSALMEMLPAVVDEMLIRLGIKEGEAEQKDEFSEPKPVEEAEAEIFNQAVDGYEMLHATPLTVGSRDVKSGREYCFEAENVGPNGAKMNVKVYVTKENGDKAPYFTLVDYQVGQ